MTDIVSRVVTTFPALVQTGSGIDIDKTAGVYTISLNLNDFWDVPGDLLVRNDEGNPQAVSTGDIGTVLTSTGIGLLPEYVAIGSPQIPPGSIGTLELADEAVTTPKLAPEAVTAAKMASDSVATSAIIDLNVTEGKVADSAITLPKMASQIEGDLLVYGLAGVPAKLSIGLPGQIPAVNAGATGLEYVAPSTPTLPAGSMVTSFFNSTNAYLTGITVISQDNTIPQISEGTQFLSLVVSPTFANSIFRIQGTVQVGTSRPTSGFVTIASFINADVNAVNSVNSSVLTQNTGALPYLFEYIPGSAAAFTVSLRVGGQSGSDTWSINGSPGSQFMGGSQIASLLVQEIVV